MTPQKISHFKILRQLGSGGASEVFLAEDTKLPRKVALKVLHKNLTQDPQQVARFRNEAEWMAMFTHPNLLTIFEIGEEEGLHYIASEYVEGETLRSKLSNGALPLRQAIEIAIGVVSALRVAHEMWVVHRDIKPENVLIHAEGYVKVLDFGVAKLMQPQPSGKAITLPRMVVGTLQYLAPEQVRGLAVDPRTDLWGVGILLFETVAGVGPFSTSNVAELFEAITAGVTPTLRERGVDVPPQLDVLVQKLLQKDPDARYGSAAELLDDLKELREELIYLDRRSRRE